MPDMGYRHMSLLSHPIQLTFTHRVFFTRAVDAADNPVFDEAMAGTRRALLVIEAAVHAAHPGFAAALADKLGPRLAAPPIVLPGGEACKQSDAVYRSVIQAVNTARIDRHDAILAVGGGAFLDAAGFAAATAHRGVRLIRFPTTTLAQADSGVGVKNGLNTFNKKNFTGSFHVPFAVINDSHFLYTQNAGELCAGLVEAVKVALIKDPEFFTWIASNLDALYEGEPAAIEHAVFRSAELHFQHITTGGDPFEFGSSRPLDFGHWAAHKLESMSAHKITHARAVAIGLAVDLTYSHLAGWLDTPTRDAVLAILRALGLPLSHPLLGRRHANGNLVVADGLEEFREHLGGELTLLMLDGIGETREIHAVDPLLLERAVAILLEPA